MQKSIYSGMTGARQNLMSGEKVVQSIYQPGKRQHVLSLLGHHIYRTKFLAHLTILTDKEIILVGDAERVTEKERSPYGGVMRYLPLRKQVTFELAELPDELWALIFCAAGDMRIERLFEASHLQGLQDFKQALSAVSPRSSE